MCQCVQAMEDFSVAYDNTVRGTGNSLLQFKFGDDGLDPSFMEDNGQPVDFDRLVMTIKVPCRATNCAGPLVDVFYPWFSPALMLHALLSPPQAATLRLFA